MSFRNANEWRHTLFETMIDRLRDRDLVSIQQAIGFWPWKHVPLPHEVAFLPKHGQMIFRVRVGHALEIQASVYLIAHAFRIGFFIPNNDTFARDLPVHEALLHAYGDGMVAQRKDMGQSTLYDWVFHGDRLPDAHLIEQSMRDAKIFSLVSDSYTQVLLHLYMSVLNILARHCGVPNEMLQDREHRRVLLTVRGTVDMPPSGATVLHHDEDNGITTMLLGYPRDMTDDRLRSELAFSCLSRRTSPQGDGDPWYWAIRP